MSYLFDRANNRVFDIGKGAWDHISLPHLPGHFAAWIVKSLHSKGWTDETEESVFFVSEFARKAWVFCRVADWDVRVIEVRGNAPRYGMLRRSNPLGTIPLVGSRFPHVLDPDPCQALTDAAFKGVRFGNIKNAVRKSMREYMVAQLHQS